ncbi:MAG: PAS domain-containing protein [Ignavibacteriales bacterium]|nr:PAS domain-containing protein [Ignavibacteriales bacterium]
MADEANAGNSLLQKLREIEQENEKLQAQIIQEKIRSQEEIDLLKYEQYLLSALMNYSPDHIYFKDRESRFVRINQSHALVFGLSSPEQAVGKTDFDFFTDEHAQGAFRDEQETIKTGIPITKEEKQTWADRPDTWVATSKMPLFDVDKNIIGTFGISVDITERKQIEEELKIKNEELKAINAAKDKIFSIIAHDLKSPFQGFLGLTEILADSTEDFSKEEMVDIGTEMYQATVNLFALIKNLLQWAQMQNGSIIFQPKTIQLAHLVIEVIESCRQRSKQKGIRIFNQVPETFLVEADETLLNSVLLNLLSNAIKFTHRGGTVVVKAHGNADQIIEISVTDTGTGMSQELVEKLFVIGEKTGKVGTEGELSTGLGLLLCKEFIEKMGGQILVESEEGKGSTFRFSLKRAEKIA